MKYTEKDLDLVLEKMGKAFDKIPFENPSVYAGWLAQTYYFVCHSTRLLSLAASRFDVTQDELHYRFIDHCKEEKAHEKIAIKDIEGVGFKFEDFYELPQTQGFYQSQYYWIERVNPASFFGYILALEGGAILFGKKLAERVAKVHGKKPTQFLAVHANEDIGHLKKAFEQTKKFDEKTQAVIWKNLETSVGLYISMLEGVTKTFSEMKPNKKAA